MAGAPRFGWRHADGELVEHPEEQLIIRCIQQWREQGEGKSFNWIAGRLNGSPETLMRGKFWSATTVRSVYRKNTPPEGQRDKLKEVG